MTAPAFLEFFFPADGKARGSTGEPESETTGRGKDQKPTSPTGPGPHSSRLWALHRPGELNLSVGLAEPPLLP